MVRATEHTRPRRTRRASYFTYLEAFTGEVRHVLGDLFPVNLGILEQCGHRKVVLRKAQKNELEEVNANAAARVGRQKGEKRQSIQETRSSR